MRAVRVHAYSSYKEFKKCTVEKINSSRKYDPIGIITDDNKRIGWTFLERIITEQAFKEQL